MRNPERLCAVLQPDGQYAIFSGEAGQFVCAGLEGVAGAHAYLLVKHKVPFSEARMLAEDGERDSHWYGFTDHRARPCFRWWRAWWECVRRGREAVDAAKAITGKACPVFVNRDAYQNLMKFLDEPDEPDAHDCAAESDET